MEKCLRKILKKNLRKMSIAKHNDVIMTRDTLERNLTILRGTKRSCPNFEL